MHAPMHIVVQTAPGAVSSTAGHAIRWASKKERTVNFSIWAMQRCTLAGCQGARALVITVCGLLMRTSCRFNSASDIRSLPDLRNIPQKRSDSQQSLQVFVHGVQLSATLTTPERTGRQRQESVSLEITAFGPDSFCAPPTFYTSAPSTVTIKIWLSCHVFRTPFPFGIIPICISQSTVIEIVVHIVHIC